MDARSSVDGHITSVTSSCLSSLSQISRMKHLLDRNTLLNVINALVFSKLYYCLSVWSSTTKKNIKVPVILIFFFSIFDEKLSHPWIQIKKQTIELFTSFHGF